MQYLVLVQNNSVLGGYELPDDFSSGEVERLSEFLRRSGVLKEGVRLVVVETA